MQNNNDSFVQSSASPAPAVLRAGAILRLLAEADGAPLSIAQLASSVGVPRSSTMNICAALVELEFVSLTRNGYVLGHGLAELAQDFMDSYSPVKRFAEACRALDPPIDATTQLATIDGGEVVYLARHDGAQMIRIASRVGGRLPANCTGLGKAMLASLSTVELEKALEVFPDPLPAMTPTSIRDMSVLRTEIDMVRERGFALDSEETTPGIVCIAVPLRSNQRLPDAFAVSASLLKADASEQKLESTATILRTLARDLALH